MFTASRILLWSALALGSAFPLKADTEFFVAPQGSDSNPGTSEKPFNSLQHAQKAVRTAIAGGASGSIVVNVRGGRYELTEPLSFTSVDSGNGKLTVTWKAVRGEEPVISGGRIITGWKQMEGRHWTADVREVRERKWQFRQLCAGDKRLTRARYPDAGEKHLTLKAIDEIKDGETVTAHHFTFDRAVPRGDLAGQQAEVVVLHHWSSARQLIADSNADSLTTLHPAGWVGHDLTSPHVNGRAYLEGAREFLDRAGEWYLDSKAGTLHYLASEGEDPSSMQFVAPVLEQVVSVVGTRENPVRRLEFQGLTFRDIGWKLPPSGYNGIQATVYGTVNGKEPTYMVPGAVCMEHAVECSLENCHIAHTAATGLAMGIGCRQNLVTGCEIHDIGGNGIFLGWQAAQDTINPTDAPQANRFTDNTIHHVGAVQLGAVGYGEKSSAGSVVAHNELHSMPYSAISVGFVWNDQPTPQRDCTVEQNHIHDCMELMFDGGGIYTLGAQPGTIIRNNYIHDIPNGHGLYADEGSSYIRVEKNVVLRAGMWGSQHNPGHDNVLVNNVIYGAGLYGIVTRVTSRNSILIERNIIVSNRHLIHEHRWFKCRRQETGDILDDMGEAVNNYLMDNNLFWDPRDQTVLFAGRTLAAWRELGHDLNSVVADPRFSDPDSGDFTLPPDSPAFQIGFQPIDLSGVGPRRVTAATEN